MGSELSAGARPAVARLVRRHRRALAGAAAAVSIATLGLALQPPDAPTHPVVVASTDLQAGRLLSEGDLVVARVPAGVLPAGTFDDSEQLLGQVLAAPVARGEALAGHRLTAPPAWSVPAGTMPLPVRFTDPGAAALLTAGQHIDVLASSGPGLDEATAFASAELVATEVLVLEVIAPESGTGGILDAPAGDADGALVLLAADRASALAIAGAQARANLGFVMHPRPR